MKLVRRNKLRVKQRREEARRRQKAYDLLTPAQKLDRLDARLGVGVGATKERKRLIKLELDLAKKPAPMKKAKKQKAPASTP
jgi:hypothetical protein